MPEMRGPTRTCAPVIGRTTPVAFTSVASVRRPTRTTCRFAVTSAGGRSWSAATTTATTAISERTRSGSFFKLPVSGRDPSGLLLQCNEVQPGGEMPSTVPA